MHFLQKLLPLLPLLLLLTPSLALPQRAANPDSELIGGAAAPALPSFFSPGSEVGEIIVSSPNLGVQRPRKKSNRET